MIVFGIDGRSPRTPTPLETVRYDGPIRLVLVVAGVVLLGGIDPIVALSTPETAGGAGGDDRDEVDA